jgi:drug/metabolite transporter (DMT)-like permease
LAKWQEKYHLCPVKIKILAALALIAANVIYGLNFVISKEVMPRFLSPEAIILLRVIGATAMFWALALVVKPQKILKSDWPRLIACALFGVAANQLLFFAGLNLSTPINASIIMTTNPVIVLLAAWLTGQERLGPIKAAGVFMAAFGAITLILQGGRFEWAQREIMIGNLLIFLNAVCYAFFIILSKPLTKKYDPISLIRWCFTIGLFMVLPFGLNDMLKADYESFPAYIWADIAFIIIGVTFFTYLLNIVALKYVTASMVAIFIYLQPLIAMIHSIWLGRDTLNNLLVFCAVLVFSGVYLVSRKANSSGVSHTPQKV